MGHIPAHCVTGQQASLAFSFFSIRRRGGGLNPSLLPLRGRVSSPNELTAYRLAAPPAETAKHNRRPGYLLAIG